MFKRMFANTIYVKVYRNRFDIRQIETRKSISIKPSRFFSTKRLLVGQFTEASKALCEGIQRIHHEMIFPVTPEILVQPMELCEDGLSQVEEKTFLELASAAGARHAKIWSGSELSDQQVLATINGA